MFKVEAVSPIQIDIVPGYRAVSAQKRALAPRLANGQTQKKPALGGHL
jgi:hypothetical protein